jgi:two-component system, cell cycle sensor histidine kinase and response regulator CckA
MKHILVADNDTGITAMVTSTLGSYHVTVAHNGFEAVALASTLPQCDLLITDYLMPGLNGDELMERLRQERPGMKTALFTGFSRLVTDPRTEFDAVWEKPIRPAFLRSQVEQLIGAA